MEKTVSKTLKRCVLDFELRLKVKRFVGWQPSGKVARVVPAVKLPELVPGIGESLGGAPCQVSGTLTCGEMANQHVSTTSEGPIPLKDFETTD